MIFPRQIWWRAFIKIWKLRTYRKLLHFALHDWRWFIIRNTAIHIIGHLLCWSDSDNFILEGRRPCRPVILEIKYWRARRPALQNRWVVVSSTRVIATTPPPNKATNVRWKIIFLICVGLRIVTMMQELKLQFVDFESFEGPYCICTALQQLKSRIYVFRLFWSDWRSSVLAPRRCTVKTHGAQSPELPV